MSDTTRPCLTILTIGRQVPALFGIALVVQVELMPYQFSKCQTTRAFSAYMDLLVDNGMRLKDLPSYEKEKVEVYT